MFCAQCCEKILSDSIKQGDDCFCSVACANLAAGYDPEDDIDYYEDNDNLIKELFSEEGISLEYDE